MNTAAARLRELAAGAAGPEVAAASRFAARPHLWLDVDAEGGTLERAGTTCAVEPWSSPSRDSLGEGPLTCGMPSAGG